MSLRGEPVEEIARLDDGSELLVRVAVPDDPYIDKSDLDTVAVELRAGDRVVATVNSVLEPEQTSEARRLARAIKAGLESGDIEPKASAIEQLADAPPV